MAAEPDDVQELIRPRGTTVVDVTYKCNARCRYCRWGDGSAGDRTALDLGKLLIPAETLQLLGKPAAW